MNKAHLYEVNPWIILSLYSTELILSCALFNLLLLSDNFLRSSSHSLTRASISSPRTSVEVATLLTDSFTASVSPEQLSLSSVGKENILFLVILAFLA